MSQKEFHIAYERMGPCYKAELVGGVVHEPAALTYSHGKHDGKLGSVFDYYACHTPGVDFAGHNSTLILGDEDEVQPDLILRIDRLFGGRSSISATDYLEGPAELVAEIAFSSEDIDLGIKKQRYALAGVLEYIVVCLRPKKFSWFNLTGNKPLAAGEEGVFRSAVFPGLWIHAQALLELDQQLLMNTLKRGLKSKEHRVFVEKLAKHAKHNSPQSP